MISMGVINAINLDGGGSASAVLNGQILNYPSDKWWANLGITSKLTSDFLSAPSFWEQGLGSSTSSLFLSKTNNGTIEYRCPRPVSTVVCVHEMRCDKDCHHHGNCIRGNCECYDNWAGPSCAMLYCGVSNCSRHGACTEGTVLISHDNLVENLNVWLTRTASDPPLCFCSLMRDHPSFVSTLER